VNLLVMLLLSQS